VSVNSGVPVGIAWPPPTTASAGSARRQHKAIRQVVEFYEISAAQGWVMGKRLKGPWRR